MDQREAVCATFIYSGSWPTDAFYDHAVPRRRARPGRS
jgi:hypothetical protein